MLFNNPARPLFDVCRPHLDQIKDCDEKGKSVGSTFRLQQAAGVSDKKCDGPSQRQRVETTELL